MNNYFDNPAISQSMIKLLLKDRKKFYHTYILKDLPQKTSKAFDEGKMFDEALEDYVKNSLMKMMSDHDCTMITELCSHKYNEDLTVYELLKTGQFQTEHYFQDLETWIDCKAKLDWLSDDKSLIIDFKTISSIDRIRSQIFSYGYHIQAAMYTKAIEILYGIVPEYILLFVAKEAPYAVKKIKLLPETLALGQSELERGLNLYNEYSITQDWTTDNSEVEYV